MHPMKSGIEVIVEYVNGLEDHSPGAKLSPGLRQGEFRCHSFALGELIQGPCDGLRFE